MALRCGLSKHKYIPLMILGSVWMPVPGSVAPRPGWAEEWAGASKKERKMSGRGGEHEEEAPKVGADKFLAAICFSWAFIQCNMSGGGGRGVFCQAGWFLETLLSTQGGEKETQEHKSMSAYVARSLDLPSGHLWLLSEFSHSLFHVFAILLLKPYYVPGSVRGMGGHSSQ